MNCKSTLNSGAVITLFLLSAALYFFRGAVDCNNTLWLDFTKAFPVALLGITTWLIGKNKLLPIALLLSACGDIAGEHGALITQIAFFAAAHIAFICHFLRYRKFSQGRVISAIVWGITMVIFGSFIVSHITSTTISIACSIYIIIIGSMVASTLFIDSKYRFWYIAAALIFLFSDSCIAWNRFIDKFNGAGLVIMTTYFTAQLIFATLYLNDKK